MKRIVYLIFIYSISFSLQGQQLPVVGQYMFNKLYYNPAYAGTNESFNANLVIRRQWLNLKNAPVTAIFNADAPIQNQKAGVGVTALYDQRGVVSQSALLLNYCYRLPLSSTTSLGMGLKGGASFIKAGYEDKDLYIKDANDRFFDGEVRNYFLPQAGAGLYLYNPKYYIGLSVPNLMAYDEQALVTLNSTVKSAPRNYIFTAGATIYVSDVLTIQPNLLLKYFNRSEYPVFDNFKLPFYSDINCNFILKDKILGGISLRPLSSFTVLGQIKVLEKVKAGFASEFQILNTLPGSWGTFEVLVTYGIE
jgi:type IX secretion system PorP/SprF family membrane protein